MSRLKRTTPLRGVVLLALVLAMGTTLGACGLEDFVPGEFFARCRVIQGLFQEAMAARIIHHPDASEKTSRLRQTWVEFQLEHGQGPPPSLVVVATASWQQALREIGRRIADMERGAEEDQVREAAIPLLAMGDPKCREALQSLAASWTVVMTASAPTDPGSFTFWLQDGGVHPVLDLLALLREWFPDERFPRLEAFLERLRSQWRFFLQADPSLAPAVGANLMPELTETVRQEYRHWLPLLWP